MERVENNSRVSEAGNLSPAEARNLGKEARSVLTEGERELSDDRRFEHILSWDRYCDADTILLYAAVREEAGTAAIAQHALAAGKAVYYPRSVVRPDKKLVFHRIQDLQELKPGAYGIPEPAALEETELTKEQIRSARTLAFVPGTAYDRQGTRIGYGAGFYDRFLADYKGTKAGLLYQVQLFDAIAADSHDIPMDHLITEDGIITVGRVETEN